MKSPLFRAGDIVRHIPSKEKWILGTDQNDDEVYPLGWPETFAKASDCILIESATDEKRMAQLKECAKLPNLDIRGRTARHQINQIFVNS